MVTEIMSFGLISQMYKCLKKSDKKKIAREYNVPDKVFESWFHCLVYLRNMCAHHSRIWNKVLAIKPLFPTKDIKWINENKIPNDRIFSLLTIINFLLNKINSKIVPDFKVSIIELLNQFPQIDIRAMGFIDEWDTHPIWML